MGINAEIKQTFQNIRGVGITYTLYPAIGAGVLAGVVCTTGLAAWGADKEIIAAAGIATEYFVCGVDIDTAGAAQAYCIDVETAGVGAVFSLRFDVTAVTCNLSRFSVPYPLRCAPAVQLTCRGSGTAAKVIGVSALVAVGL